MMNLPPDFSPQKNYIPSKGISRENVLCLFNTIGTRILHFDLFKNTKFLKKIATKR